MTPQTQDNFGIGAGIYTIPDVSAILGLPPAKVRRWLTEYWNVKFAGANQLIFSEGTGKNLTTNFHTLIEFFTFYQLREEGVTAQRIVKAHQVLEEIFDTRYPFAKSNILTDGKQVLFTGLVGEIIKADETLQIAIREVFEPFCRKIDFNSSDLAERFYPLGKDHAIIIDPKRQFGQPLIGKTNILAETVYGLYQGGETIDLIVRLYDLSIPEVEDAIHFYQNVA